MFQLQEKPICFINEMQQPHEWEYMWEALAQNALNAGIQRPKECVNRYEVWEYLHTFKTSSGVAHCFRHRCHPKSPMGYTYLYIPVSTGFRPQKF